MSRTWNSPILERYAARGQVGETDGCVSARKVGPIEADYRQVRDGLALVDNSHYGKFRVAGPAALALLDRVNFADISRLAINKLATSLILRDDGSVMGDAYVANLGGSYLLLTEGVDPKAVAALLDRESGVVDGDVSVTDSTRELAMVGLDGPYAWELLKDLIGARVLGMRYMELVADQAIGGASTTIFRAGKTGEFGYQILVESGRAAQLWDHLIEAGAPYDLEPSGLDAIDLCKLENRFLNMGREGSKAASPLELNCRVMFSREKDDFVGRGAIEGMLPAGPDRRLIGLSIGGDDRGAGVPPLGSEVVLDGEPIGTLVNAAYSPGLSRHIGLGLLDARLAYVGLDYKLRSDGTTWPARTVSAPFILNRSLEIRPQEVSYHTRNH